MKQKAKEKHAEKIFLDVFDVQLQQFYLNVITKEIQLWKQEQTKAIRHALKEVVDAYKKKTVREYKSFIRFDTSPKRCAYLLKHSPLFTSAVAKYLSRLVNGNPNVLRDPLIKGELTICCLGGGPASDAVAVLRIIRDLYQPHWKDTGKVLKVTVNVVDISEDWHETAENVLNVLKDTPEFIGESQIELTYHFYSADLTDKMDEKVKNAIQMADLITMVYFVSAVNGSANKDKTQDMLETIFLNMKKGAFLFFLDSAADHHYQVLNKAAVNRKCTREIYGPLVEEFHTLSFASVEKFLDLYSDYFYKFLCMTNIFLSVSSWQKPREIHARQLVKTVLKPKPDPWNVPTEEESDNLTDIMLRYRDIVQNIFQERCNSYEIETKLPISLKSKPVNVNECVKQNSKDTLNMQLENKIPRPRALESKPEWENECLKQNSNDTLNMQLHNEIPRPRVLESKPVYENACLKQNSKDTLTIQLETEKPSSKCETMCLNNSNTPKTIIPSRCIFHPFTGKVPIKT